MWYSCALSCADFTVTCFRMSSITPFTFALISIPVLLLILSVVRAASIEIGIDKRILPIPNNVTLTCKGLDDDMINESFKIKREVDGQTTVFTNYTPSIRNDNTGLVRVASFLLTPELEGIYSCEVGLVTSTNSIVLLGESV